MIDNDYIDNIIKFGIENDFVDFKAKQYIDKEALIKDIMSMANSRSIKDKYIIIGIKVLNNGEKQYIGINKSDFVDSSEYQQLIYANIEPDLDIEYIPYSYKGVLLGIIRIKNTFDKPYMMKKDYRNLKQGLCYIRKGSQQNLANRLDYDFIYLEKQEISFDIKENVLYVIGDKGLSNIKLLLKNYSNNPITIIWGLLEIYMNDELLSKHRLYGFDNKVVGADFFLEIPPKTEKYGDGIFSFESSDCIRLKLDSEGFKYNAYSMKLIIQDANDNVYENNYDNMSVFAKGKVLWKVMLRDKENNMF